MRLKNTYSLQELFHGRVFRVPEYQRGYAWEDRQVDEFLDDLALLVDSRRHYTGTIVLHQPADAAEIGDNEGTRYVEANVVDGQQRLTTVVVLINEIANALDGYDDRRILAEGIRKRYVAATDLGGLPLHKLTLGQEIDHYFKTFILPNHPEGVGGPPVESARRLFRAKERISEYLAEANGAPKDRREWLQILLDKVTMRLQFNLYEVEQEAEVGVIFEVMNDRGIPLSELEKVKNYLLYAAQALNVDAVGREKLAKDVNEAWATILRQLMVADLGTPAFENQLLRSHWLMAYEPQARRWQGSRSLRSKFDLRCSDHRDLLVQLIEYVAGLRNSCAAFCDAVRPHRNDSFGNFNQEERNQLVLWGRNLMRIGYTATFVPLLMAIRMRWPDNADKYLEALQLSEVLAFRTYRVARYYSTYRQSSMIRLAFRIRKGLEFSEAMIEMKRLFGNRGPREAFEGFTNAETVQGWYGRGGLNYFLYEYESHLAKKLGGSPRVQWEGVDSADSIEHILPQYIGDREYWRSRFSLEEHERYRHDLGNLTLTKGNSALSNKPFPQKAGSQQTCGYCYVNSLLQVEREIAADWTDWTPKSVDQRRARMLEWAKSRWHVEFG